MTTLREHLEAIIDAHRPTVVRDKSDFPWPACSCGDYPLPCRSKRHAVAALAILDSCEYAKLTISRHRGGWRLVHDPEKPDA